jgi:hypothetical protein
MYSCFHVLPLNNAVPILLALASNWYFLTIVQTDFKKYFNAAPGYYTMEQIGDKIASTIAANHPLKNLNTLYVSGVHSDEAASIQQVFGQYFDAVHTKDTLLQGRAADHLATLKNVQAALVDQDVCKHATIFIGNNHSKWLQLSSLPILCMYHVTLLCSLYQC